MPAFRIITPDGQLIREAEDWNEATSGIEGAIAVIDMEAESALVSVSEAAIDAFVAEFQSDGED